MSVVYQDSGTTSDTGIETTTTAANGSGVSASTYTSSGVNNGTFGYGSGGATGNGSTTRAGRVQLYEHGNHGIDLVEHGNCLALPGRLHVGRQLWLRERGL